MGESWIQISVLVRSQLTELTNHQDQNFLLPISPKQQLVSSLIHKLPSFTPSFSHYQPQDMDGLSIHLSQHHENAIELAFHCVLQFTVCSRLNIHLDLLLQKSSIGILADQNPELLRPSSWDPASNTLRVAIVLRPWAVPSNSLPLVGMKCHPKSTRSMDGSVQIHLHFHHWNQSTRTHHPLKSS